MEVEPAPAADRVPDSLAIRALVMPVRRVNSGRRAPIAAAQPDFSAAIPSPTPAVMHSAMAPDRTQTAVVAQVCSVIKDSAMQAPELSVKTVKQQPTAARQQDNKATMHLAMPTPEVTVVWRSHSGRRQPRGVHSGHPIQTFSFSIDFVRNDVVSQSDHGRMEP